MTDLLDKIAEGEKSSKALAVKLLYDIEDQIETVLDNDEMLVELVELLQVVSDVEEAQKLLGFLLGTPDLEEWLGTLKVDDEED